MSESWNERRTWRTRSLVTEGARARSRSEVSRMDQSMSSQGMASGQMAGDHEMEMHDGDDFVCSNCGCEITIKHHATQRR